MPRALYLGIDNTQPNVVRVVCLTSEALLDTWPCCWTCSKSLLAFQIFWKANLGTVLPDAAATTIIGHDPFEIMAWLREKGIPITSYPRQDLHEIFAWGPDDEELEFSQTYHRAHALALRAAYDAEAPIVVGEILEEVQMLRYRLATLQQTAERLQQLLPCPF